MRLVALVYACSTLLPITATSQSATPGQAPVVPAAISDAVVKDLMRLAETNHSWAFLGLSKTAGDRHVLSVVSNRVMLAFMSAKTREEGGRYTPPASMRRDVVTVDCGDDDLGEIFDCERVTVSTPALPMLKPLTYRSGPRAYKNALGVSWSVARVTATYDVHALRNGFTVTAFSDDGTEWPLEISADEAASKLFLGSRLPSQQAESIGPPPQSLNVAVSKDGDGWRITNMHSSYVWRNCAASIGESTVRLPALEPTKPVTVNRRDFSPRLQESMPSTFWVTCKTEGTTFTASRPAT